MTTRVVSHAAPVINKTVLMTGADYFGVANLNPYSDDAIQPDIAAAAAEHSTIRAALISAGVDVVSIPAPKGCPDGIYAANWALVLRDTAILSNLPGPRQSEEAAAEAALKQLGFKTIRPPYRFSGQGDALPVGNYLLCGQTYRTDPRMHGWLAEHTGREVISLQTIPQLDDADHPVTNQLTGWPDSYFYDIDLAIAVLSPGLIAWCPEAFTTDSQATLRSLTDLQRVEASYDEARYGFALNLVSTGRVVVMSDKAPKLQAELQLRGFETITPTVVELPKGGGYIRCTSLTLDNQ